MLYYSIFTLFVTVFIFLDGPKIIKSTVEKTLVPKYRNFRRLNNAISTRYKSIFMILWVSVYMICQSLYINFIQYINSTVKKIDKNKYEITYIINGKTYKMIVKQKRGPKKVLMVYDENQEDISREIFSYLGPEENFHGKIYTPSFFNKKQLVFELSNGDECEFKNKDPILIEYLKLKK